jgi:phosphoribosylformimino-5-aminoimidazole carboxamide ribotide isomerase
MIVPSIDIRNGRAVQLREGRELVLDGGDPLQRLEEFALAGEVAVVDLDAAFGHGDNAALIRTMVQRAPCRVGGGIRTLAAARAWLDAGATSVVLGTAATPEICRELPRERVIAAVDARRGEVVGDGGRRATGENVTEAIARLAPFVSGFLLTQVEREGAMAGFDLELLLRAKQVASAARLTAAGGIHTAAQIAELDRHSIDAQVGMALYKGALALVDAVAAPLVSDRPDGLWPTVVCDEAARALGLVYSNRTSLAHSLVTRRAAYWSRSRGSMWVKGETSGDTQELVRVDLDCDRDTLRFTVRQLGSGSFCHLARRACWPGPFTLHELEERLEASRDARDPASRTRRLMDDPALLDAKLREEASELGAARTAEEVRREAADVLYFTLVAAARHGVTVDQITHELFRRSLSVTRRPLAAKE